MALQTIPYLPRCARSCQGQPSHFTHQVSFILHPCSPCQGSKLPLATQPPLCPGCPCGPPPDSPIPLQNHPSCSGSGRLGEQGLPHTREPEICFRHMLCVRYVCPGSLTPTSSAPRLPQLLSTCMPSAPASHLPPFLLSAPSLDRTTPLPVCEPETDLSPKQSLTTGLAVSSMHPWKMCPSVLMVVLDTQPQVVPTPVTSGHRH